MTDHHNGLGSVLDKAGKMRLIARFAQPLSARSGWLMRLRRASDRQGLVGIRHVCGTDPLLHGGPRESHMFDSPSGAFSPAETP